ncbi:hypothetical protein L541_1544 [Bordetella hinzii CA90 BAL1384]|uniref:Uncharacterized protein n=1 Tax=Bordetella hinzii OH87 BAL007II TaxID=1331262 RepID=A0ABR4QV90_9BORD|nr:hypothetical protein L544_1195 [Bordetella hinzii OH87 BAL007II]KCB33398.1 hypothetical protein L541_1544 [Bordetella hinzii CA90 BAL1384]KCB33798.1 hypothetical protein L543_1004 [Bordetella hinzii L60]KCB43901.1 hypothetical protein L539_1446 [Bordetella hinzii 5132]KCB49121.1 hypothetical protein L537_1462 [Bordetella hinzii 1277]KCB49852.1 hypothetical protein L538_1222 [Bordetella hinzii 4161]
MFQFHCRPPGCLEINGRGALDDSSRPRAMADWLAGRRG